GTDVVVHAPPPSPHALLHGLVLEGGQVAGRYALEHLVVVLAAVLETHGVLLAQRSGRARSPNQTPHVRVKREVGQIAAREIDQPCPSATPGHRMRRDALHTPPTP